MLLNSSGLLKVGEPAGSVVCSGVLFMPVDNPAGAGCPFDVTAVAVVTFFITVLLKNRTFGASSMATPPPSWVDTLLAIMLL